MTLFRIIAFLCHGSDILIIYLIFPHLCLLYNARRSSSEQTKY